MTCILPRWRLRPFAVTAKRIQEKSDGFDHMKNKRFCFPTVW